MPRFSKRSLDNLNTADEKLQLLFNEVIKEFDVMVIDGHRSLGRQKKLFDEGKSQIDGISTKGKHNYSPSRAVDVVPYPIDWNNIDRFKEMGEYVKEVAKGLDIDITWGGDWKSFKDYPHFQIS